MTGREELGACGGGAEVVTLRDTGIVIFYVGVNEEEYGESLVIHSNVSIRSRGEALGLIVMLTRS